MKKLIDKLQEDKYLKKEELDYIISNIDENNTLYLMDKADRVRKKIYGKEVYLRGLVEFTNFCRNDCKYCGIRLSNKNAKRYRIDKKSIVNICKKGFELGYRTFVLQGGEDLKYKDSDIVEIVKNIKKVCKENVAVTLSIGERSYESYKKFYDAGADRFLIRHETISKNLYEKLHPNMSYENRIKCLESLKKIGYQIGAGFMVGVPGQTNMDLAKDLLFLKKLQPHMVGIGPFIPHKETPFKNESPGDVRKTIVLLSLIRLLLPKVLLPATTALATASGNGRANGLKAGANVIMPNLTPEVYRKKYMLYNNKKSSGTEEATQLENIRKEIKEYGYCVDMGRGDHIDNMYVTQI